MATAKKGNRKKKQPVRKKRSPGKTNQPLLPALIFLGLAAALIAVLYLFIGHYPPGTGPNVKRSTAHSKPEKTLPLKPLPDRSEKGRDKPAATIGLPHLTIYRLSRDYSRILSFTIPADAGLTKAEKARLIIHYLTLPGEDDQPPLPRATRVRAVSFTMPLITIDLSSDIRTGLINSGANDELLTAACLTNSLLKNFSDCKKLQILIEGKRCKTLAGHINIYSPLGYQFQE